MAVSSYQDWRLASPCISVLRGKASLSPFLLSPQQESQQLKEVHSLSFFQSLWWWPFEGRSQLAATSLAGQLCFSWKLGQVPHSRAVPKSRDGHKPAQEIKFVTKFGQFVVHKVVYGRSTSTSFQAIDGEPPGNPRSMERHGSMPLQGSLAGPPRLCTQGTLYLCQEMLIHASHHRSWVPWLCCLSRPFEVPKIFVGRCGCMHPQTIINVSCQTNCFGLWCSRTPPQHSRDTQYVGELWLTHLYLSS